MMKGFKVMLLLLMSVCISCNTNKEQNADDKNATHVVSSEDRKSTRLNSSHVKISYAVFCLKKKIYTPGGATISWKSTKQTALARSTMESKFIVIDKAVEEAE